MRILIDLQGAQATHRGRGIGRYSLSLAKALVRQKGPHEIQLLLNAHFPNSVDEIQQAFFGSLPASHVHVWKALEPIDDLRTENQERRRLAHQVRQAIIDAIAPDVVLLTSLFEGPGNSGLVSIDSDGPPVAVVLYDLIPLVHQDSYLTDPTVKDWYFGRLEELRKANMLLAISEYSRQEAISYLSWDADKIANISAACDDIFSPSIVTDRVRQNWQEKYGLYKSFLMYTGGVDKRKNIENLICAYALIGQELRNAHQLLIVCAVDDEHRNRLFEVASKAGLSHGEMIMTGYVDDAELVAFYNACKAFVFPSWHEGFGLPVLEAMRCGAAVITSNTSSLPEVLNMPDAQFDPFDQDAIRDRIQWVLTGKKVRQSLQSHAITQAEAFNWDLTAKKAIKAMESSVDRKLAISAESTRPRLACVSPLPPARTGISDYTAMLIRELVQHYDIDVIVQQQEISDAWILQNCTVRTVQWFLENIGFYERVIYHMGNSHFHEHMLYMLERVPGVVILHDFFLSGLQAHHAQSTGELSWMQKLYESHGYPALLADQIPSDRGMVLWTYPINLSVLQQSLGIIVHSEFSRRLARQWYGSNAADQWQIIPLMRENPLSDIQDKANIRDLLQIHEDAFVVCSFGLLGKHKLNHDLLEAFLTSALARDPKCLLIFVGAIDEGPYKRALHSRIEMSNLSSRIRITGWVNALEYQQYLLTADLAVQLRTLSRGETSAAVLDCMSHGLATIVNANGSMADLDSSAVWMLPDEYRLHELSMALEILWNSPQQRTHKGHRAKQVIRSQHLPSDCARQYKNAIEYFYETPQNSLPAIKHRLGQYSLNEVDKQSLIGVLSSMLSPTTKPRQVLVDISELIQRDSKTGIQRVTRAVLNEWLRMEVSGWVIEPVWATPDEPGYRYARHFTSHFLGLPTHWANDSVVQVHEGDIFLGLDLQPSVIPAQMKTLKKWQYQGVKIRFVVYDLLPVQFPQYFVEGAEKGFLPWLQTIVEFDGAICISKSTQNELQDWLQQQSTGASNTLKIDYFQLGADLEHTSPTKGLPENFDHLNQAIADRKSFLMVGTLEPRKGHEQVLNAFDELWINDEPLNLIIVGKQGWLVDQLVERLNNHCENGKKLFWLTNASDEYLSHLYQRSIALIAASFGEGFGLPIIEASRHHCAVIARNLPVFREVAATHAFFFDCETGAELAKCIKEWLNLWALDQHPKSGGMHHLMTWKKSADALFKWTISGAHNL